VDQRSEILLTETISKKEKFYKFYDLAAIYSKRLLNFMGLRRKLLCFYPTTETGSKLNPAVFRIRTHIDLALLDPYWEYGSGSGSREIDQKYQ
jgi:hypothetical protein